MRNHFLRAAGRRDPYFANVSLLLHGNGTNGSTTITDNSPSPKAVTAVGNAQISAASSKFGGASINFDGSGDYLELASSADLNFGTADFTVEAWINLTQMSGTRYPSIIGSNVGSWGAGAVSLSAGHTAYPLKLQLYANGNETPILFSTSNVVNTGTFVHVACTRSAGTWRMFVNGVLESTNSTRTDAINISTNGTRVGADGWNGALGQIQGYIDDLRITKGVARYTANFTPPTAPFPDF